ncbi:MAG TPA: hypothetical protein VMF69_05265 [Gemmataceae bacterium]|nr:hypothetical protein [Gemmataceae bacterium]
MPMIFRTMKRADDGLPVVGSNSKELGVRIPPNPNADIDLDANDCVVLNGKGLSVAANWRKLPGYLIPKCLRTLFPGAAGPNTLACYKMGTGVFAPAAVSNALTLVLKKGNPQSGNIVPNQSVHRDQFQADLAAIRDQWTVDET